MNVPVAVAQVYYVGDQSTLKDNNGTASYHDALNWLNYHSPGGVIPGTDPVQHDDADGPGIAGNGRAVFDPATDHRPGNVGGAPPDPWTYGRPNYIYFGDFLDRRTFSQDKVVPGGVARPNSVEIISGAYTFDLGSNNFGKAGGLSVAEQIVVGQGTNSNASLTIRNGAVTQDVVGNWAGLIVGSGVGANGRIIVEGANASLEIARDIWLGNAGGTGRIDVIDGGQLTARSIGPGLQNVLGRPTNSVLNVQGVGSFVRGISGINNGDLIVSAGGQVVSLLPDGSKNWAWLGTSDGSDGSARITGPGSSWTEMGRLTIGGVYHTDTSGTGHLIIDNGGYVESDEAVLANRSLSQGDVQVIGHGSQWKVNGYAYLGEDGYGSILIANGGTMTTGGASIGNGSNGVGSVTVTGAGSRWVSGGQVTVGNLGDGQLTVKNGAVVQYGSMIVGSRGDGVVNIETGASLDSADGVMVGGNGSGRLTVRTGAHLDAGATFILGYSAGSDGTVEVTGPQSSLTTTVGTIGGGVSIVGGKILTNGGGQGTLNIHDGGQVTSTQVAVGFNGTGQANVSGPGSRWEITEGLGIGYFQSGALNISQGGVVDAAFAVVAGAYVGNSGQIHVSGPGSALRIASNAPDAIGPAGSLQLGGSLGVIDALGPAPDGPGGTASLVVSSGGRVLVPSVLSLWGGASIDVAAGGLVQIGNATSTQAGSLQIGAGGVLQGSGEVRGNVFSNSGVIRPEFSTGILTIQGNLANNGQLQLDLGPNGFDQLQVSGQAALGGVLQLHQAANFQPAIDDEFRVLDAAAVTGRFAELTGYKMDDQLQLAPFIGATSVTLRVVLSGDATLDRVVDGADYVVWADNFLSTKATYTQGDFNNDGFVDGADYTVWADHFLASARPALAIKGIPEANSVLADGRTIIGYGNNPLDQNEAWIATVPEPSTWLLASCGALVLPFVRRRWQR